MEIIYTLCSKSTNIYIYIYIYSVMSRGVDLLQIQDWFLMFGMIYRGSNQGAVDVAWFQRDLFRRAFGLHNKAFFRAVYIETMAQY